LQSQVDYAQAEISNLNSNTRSEINAIYANVDAMLKKEVSLIELASTKLGALDIDNLTVPVVFSITPKEVSENTTVSLDIEGELIPMNRIGTTFSATVSCDIFGSVSPTIVIDESGVKKTTQDDRLIVWSMKDSLLPIMYPQFSGEARYSNGTYQFKKTLYRNVKYGESGIVFTEIRLAIKVDEEVISDEVIPMGTLSAGWQVDKTIPLSDGQICIMMLIATDSIGLEHRYTVDHWIGGANAQREPRFDDEQIYSAEGKLLWKAE
jgi:hypothetical protein